MNTKAKTVTLTAKQEKFAVGISAGLSQSDAYRAAYNAVRMKPKQVWEEASRLRHNYKVAARIEELLKTARIEDVTNLGREIRRAIDLQQAALEDGNHNAAAAYQRMLMKAVGALQDRLVLTVESQLSDEQLLEKLSGGDPEKLAAARLLLGAPSGFPENYDGETRH